LHQNFRLESADCEAQGFDFFHLQSALESQRPVNFMHENKLFWRGTASAKEQCEFVKLKLNLKI
jgi:hypothetical protein